MSNPNCSKSLVDLYEDLIEINLLNDGTIEVEFQSEEEGYSMYLSKEMVEDFIDKLNYVKEKLG